MTQLAISIIWCVLQVSLLCTVGGLVYLVIRTFEPRLGRTSVAVLLFLVTILSLTALSPWPSWQLFARSPSATTDTTVRPSDAATPSPVGAEDSSAMSAAREIHSEQQVGLLGSAFWQAMWEELNRPNAAPESAIMATAATSRWHWSTTLLIILCTASTIGILRLAAAFVALRRWRLTSRPIDSPRLQSLTSRLQREMGATGPLELREAATIQSAATMGLRRPVILLPSPWREWPQEELRAVLAHELAHVRARDWPAWLIAQIAVTLHFYHPLVHWLARRLRLEQELAADAAAAAVTGSKEEYLGTLAAQMLRTDKARLTWAAQTFLPTRSTIVRRIEMLKSKSPLPLAGKHAGRGRLAVIGALSAICLVAAGLRGPAGPAVGAAKAQAFDGGGQGQPASEGVANNDQGGLQMQTFARFVDARAVFFAYLRPSEIFAGDDIAPIKVQFDQMIAESRGELPELKLDELEAFAFSPYLTADRHEAVTTILQFASPNAAERLRTTQTAHREVETIGDYRLFSVSGERSGKAAILIGDDTLVFDGAYGRLRTLAARLVAGDATSPEWMRQAHRPNTNPQLWAALNMDLIRAEFAREVRKGGPQGPLPLAMLSPLVEKPAAVSITGEFTPDLALTAVATCTNEADAQQVYQTARALVTLARNMLAEQRKAEVPDGTPQAMIAATLEMADRVLEQAKLDADGSEVRLSIAAGSLPQQLVQMAFVLPAIQSARQAARRTQSMNNLKQLGLAMLNYHDAHGHFPPPVVTGPDGKTKHSWRVAILPFLEQAALYDEYRLTEPWDSEHNKRILESMPAVFRSPTEPGGTTTSAYYVLLGAKTMFDPDGNGAQLSEILDGTSNTLMVVEADRDTPWTKPEDIAYLPDQPLPTLGGFFEGIFLAAFADGHVQVIDKRIDQTVLRRMIEKADGQPIQQ